MKKIKILALLLIFTLVACGVEAWREHYDLGNKYLMEGNYEEAILEFNKAIEIDDKQAVIYIGRGHAYIGLGETEENLGKAFSDYEMAVSLDSTNADAYLGLADVYIRRGEYDKALEFLKEALAKTGENEAISAKIAEMEDGEFKDASGKTRRVDYHGSDGKLLFYRITEYDDNGNLMKITHHEGNGTFAGYGIVEYDATGKAVKMNSYLPDGKFIAYETYEYNGDNKIVRRNHYGVNGVLFAYETYEYDETNKKTNITHYDAEYNADGSIRYNQQRLGFYLNTDGTLENILFYGSDYIN